MKVSSHTQFQKIATKVQHFSELRKDFRKKAYKSQNKLRMWDFFVLLQPKNWAVRFVCLGMPLTIILFFHTD